MTEPKKNGIPESAKEEFRIPGVCLATVRKQGRTLQFVPDEFKTHELCLAAVRQYAWALEFVPEELRTPEICLAAVEQNAWTLQLVPEESRTAELVLAAASQYGLMPRKYVPEKFNPPWRGLSSLFQFVPEKLKTAEFIHAYVQICAAELRAVPEELKTHKICLAAVQQEGWALQYVPESTKTAEICLAAVKQNGWALQYVPDELKTAEICLVAVKQDGWVLVEHVPQKLRIPEIILAAVKQIDDPEPYFTNYFKMGVFGNRERIERAEPADFDAATESALQIYRLAKLEKPPVILRMDSPFGAMLGGALAAMLLNEGKNGQNKLHFLLNACNAGVPQDRERIISEIMRQVKEWVGRHVSDSQWHFAPSWYLFGIVMDEDEELDMGGLGEVPLRNFLRQMLERETDRLGIGIFDKVTSQIMKQTKWPLEGPFSDHPDDEGFSFSMTGNTDMPRSDWRSFVSAFQEFGENRHEVFSCFDIDEAIACLCGDAWWHKDVLAISDRPKEIHRDDEGRFHNDRGPAISWHDGLSLYYWRGVAIPEGWLTGKPPSAAQALAWGNMEQRRAACEIVGWANIFAELDAKVIDENADPQIGILYEADIGIPGMFRGRFLKVVCGTGREFVLPVPPNVNTAQEANAWTWGLDPHEYRPEVRT